jgi:hypothetical protein
MRGSTGRFKRAWLLCCVLVALGLAAVGAASCGSSATSKSATGNSVKTPPGVSQTQAASTTPASATSPTASSGTTPSTSDAQSQTKTPANAADLVGGRFTVVNATRPDTNKSAISSSQREVKGDYLEVEFTIQNVSTDHLVDLSEYSFRLQSPGIAASTYEDYYGTVGTYGAYVSDHVISASLLSYSDLAPVTYQVKVGELVDKVFCFFDLNPENVARNPNVTKDNTNLIIRKVSGTDYGDQVSIPLAGYPD